MIKILERKYGVFITNKLLNANKEVCLSRCNLDGVLEQKEVIKHIKTLKDVDGVQLVPDHFFKNKIEWGFDYSGWIGSLDSDKKYIFIGAEPNINHNYKVTYDFGTIDGMSAEQVALKHYNTKWTKTTRDIWNIIADMMAESQDEKTKIDFLKSSYITDLCHFVPKGCGNVSQICDKLEISKSEWKSMRSKCAKSFLAEEILGLNPEAVILHGTQSRKFFLEHFGIQDINIHKIESSILKIIEGSWKGIKILSIPHLSGDIRNKLWKCRAHPQRPISAFRIIQKILHKKEQITNVGTTKTVEKTKVYDKEEPKQNSDNLLNHSLAPIVKAKQKYTDRQDLEVHLKEFSSSQQIEFCFRMLDDLSESYFIKTKKSGFTLYAPKKYSSGDQLFANFYLHKPNCIEIRFLYHDEVVHPNVKLFPEMKNNKLAYLLNQYNCSAPYVYDEGIKKLMHGAYSVIHEGRHKELKQEYKFKNNLK